MLLSLLSLLAAASVLTSGGSEPTPGIPVLMYHTSSENNPGDITELYIKPSEFEKQIKYLTENNYTLCTFDDWHKLHEIQKPVFITFDDGYYENYTDTWNNTQGIITLKAHHLPGHHPVPSGRNGAGNGGRNGRG